MLVLCFMRAYIKPALAIIKSTDLGDVFIHALNYMNVSSSE